MEVLNHEQNDVRLLIADIIKYMVDAPQRPCGHLCIINDLYSLFGVCAQLDDVMVSHMMPINKSTMRRIP